MWKGSAGRIYWIKLIFWGGKSIISNLDTGLPFKNESVYYIRAHFVLEHLKNPEFVVNECYRVLKQGGIFDIRLPHFSGGEAYGFGHMTYYSFIGLLSMITPPSSGVWNDEDYRGKFQLIEQRIDVRTSKWLPYTYLFKLAAKFAPAVYERHFCFFASAWAFELKLVKKEKGAKK